MQPGLWEKTSSALVDEPLTVLRSGKGPKVLVLHDEWGIGGAEQFWAALSGIAEVILPIHPGFEDAETSANLKTVNDLALLYLRLLEQEEAPVVVLGLSFGGWVALEMATKCAHHIAELVLVGPVGLRFGPPETRNFADLFALDDQQLAATLYARPDLARLVTTDSSSEEVLIWARNREATARYSWEPYLHTPGLSTWTRHLQVPTTLVHGKQDRFVMDGYYEQFAQSLEQCSVVEVEGAGHFPHLEDPEATLSALHPVLEWRRGLAPDSNVEPVLGNASRSKLDS